MRRLFFFFRCPMRDRWGKIWNQHFLAVLQTVIQLSCHTLAPVIVFSSLSLTIGESCTQRRWSCINLLTRIISWMSSCSNQICTNQVQQGPIRTNNSTVRQLTTHNSSLRCNATSQQPILKTSNRVLQQPEEDDLIKHVKGIDWTRRWRDQNKTRAHQAFA